MCPVRPRGRTQTASLATWRSHWTQVVLEMGVESYAGCESPRSTGSATLLIPRSGAQATPATGTVPAFTVDAGLGTSIREAVLIGPSFAHPSGTQYASNACSVVSS